MLIILFETSLDLIPLRLIKLEESMKRVAIASFGVILGVS